MCGQRAGPFVMPTPSRLQAHRAALVAARLIGNVAVLVAVLVGCGARDRRTPADTLVVLIDTPITTVDPRLSRNNYESKLARLVAPGLTAVDTVDLVPRLELAEAVEAVDPVTFVVTLRPGLRFSDGSPLTAVDVAFTYRTILGGLGPFARSLAEKLAGVDALDARRARFRLHRPLATFFTDLDMGIVSMRAAGLDGVFAGGDAVGAGPYRLVTLGDTRLTLVANPHYHGAAPQLPRLDLRIVRDATARILMLVGGSADLVQNGVRVDLLDDVAARSRVTVASGPSALLTYMMLNNDDPLLRDVRVRQAIALAIDRPAVIAAKFGGRAVLASGLLPPSHWAFNPRVTRWEHDLARARGLLDAAGLRDPDGDGPAPRARFVYKTSADQFRVAIARVLAAQLAEVGLEVEVRAFEFATVFADIKKGSFQIASMQTTDITGPDFYHTYFHSGRIPTSKDPDAGNRWRYRNTRVDELTVAGRGELDQAQQRRIYDEVQAIVADEVPVVPLWHEDNVVVANRTVRGYQIVPNARLVGLITTTK